MRHQYINPAEYDRIMRSHRLWSAEHWSRATQWVVVSTLYVLWLVFIVWPPL